jgi:hypothetical protein
MEFFVLVDGSKTLSHRNCFDNLCGGHVARCQHGL